MPTNGEVPGTIPEVQSASEPRHGAYHHMWVFFVLSALGLALAGWFGEALTFSGSNYFLHVVDLQALWHPLQRYASAPLQLPTLLASGVTSNVAVLRKLWGLSYMFAPFSALVVSWLVVRRRAPRLMVWPAIAVSIVCFPTLLSPISESAIVTEWAWPLVMLTLVGLDGPWSIAAAVLVSAFLMFMAANALFVFILVAAIAVGRAFSQPAVKRRLIVWAIAMVVAAWLRYFALNEDFAARAHKISLDIVARDIRASYLGWPLAAYLLAVAACACLLYLRIGKARGGRLLTFLPACLLLLAGIALTVYVLQGHSWQRANHARDVVLLFEIPLIAIAAVDHLYAQRHAVAGVARRTEEAARLPVVLTCGIVIFACLGLWSARWSDLTSDVTSKLQAASSYCVSPSAVSRGRTDLDRTYLGNLAVDLQSRTPAHVVINPKGCRLLRDTGVLDLFDFHHHVANGWFHFSSAAVSSGHAPSASKHVSAPLIKSFSPSSGRAGTKVTIKGKNLSGATKVTIDGVPARITRAEPKKIKIEIPPNAKSGHIAVTTPDGTVVSSGSFRVSSP